MFLSFGVQPNIHVLSYVNLPADPFFERTNTRTISFSMLPDQYGFFIFPPVLRTFEKSNTTIPIHEAKVSIHELASDGRVMKYQVELPDNKIPLYFFSGEGIQSLHSEVD
jgi:hypothetical protein